MSDESSRCRPEDHEPPATGAAFDPEAIHRAAAIFRAMGDAPRLHTLHLLLHHERCVTELVVAMKEKTSTVSQRLRVLRAERLVIRRRQGTHVYYALADAHVAALIRAAVDHATEFSSPMTSSRSDSRSQP